MSRALKVALAHDWLNGMRGGERCLDLICQEFPQAELYTLLFRPELVSEAIRNRKVMCRVCSGCRVSANTTGGFCRCFRWRWNRSGCRPGRIWC